MLPTLELPLSSASSIAIALAIFPAYLASISTYFMAPHQYSPLNEEAGEIRLLTLHPGPLNSEIYVVLHNETLTKTNTPAFEALSYTWGSMENLHDIRVGPSGNDVLSVTRNLAVALQYLRYAEKVRVLWIDAVCIDQKNTKERGQQVERMRDIYTLADRVVVWLGVEEQNSTYALQLMSTLSSKIEVDWLLAVMKPSMLGEGEPDWTDRSKPLPYEGKELDAIYSLLHRSWFERLWIRQEIRLASKRSIIMCGNTSIPWQAFRNAIFCLRHKSKKKEFLGVKAVPFHERIEMVYQLSDDASPVPFGRLVRMTKHCKCSDPRDRVYGLLSMLQKSEREIGIKPDYSLTTGQVYQDVVLRFIHHFNTLKILASCEMQEKPSDMPTWVPNWSVGNIADPLWSPLADAQSPAAAEYLGNGVLSAAGVYAATIQSAEKINFVNSSNPELIATIRRHAPADVLYGSTVGGVSLLDAYCRTICCDYFGEGYLPSLSHFPTFQESREALISFLTQDRDSTIDLTPSRGPAKYLDWAWSFLQGRSFFTSGEGYIGLAPRAAQPGDEICVLLGCQSPLLLRQTQETTYQVVGECYVYGLMHGEAFLGQLHQKYRPILMFDDASKDHIPAFLDTETEETQVGDPRMKGLLKVDGIHLDQGDRGKHAGSTLTPELLKDLGVDVKVFELS